MSVTRHSPIRRGRFTSRRQPARMPNEETLARPAHMRYAPPRTAAGRTLGELIAEMTREELHEHDLTGEIAGLLADAHTRTA